MKLLAVIVALALGCCACAGDRGGTSSGLLAPGDVWIRDVTVDSPERDAPLSHAQVVVRGGRIASVGIEKP